MKATNHPKIIIDVDKELKQRLVNICQIKKISIKDYILSSLIPQMDNDSLELVDKLRLLEELNNS